EFTTSTDLHALTLIGAPVPWEPGEWTAGKAEDKERTPDLGELVQQIVKRDQYTPQSAVASIVTGSGLRIAKSYEGAAAEPPAPVLTVESLPRVAQQDFLTCGDPARAQEICENDVRAAVTEIAGPCHVGTSCKCGAHTGVDTSGFSAVCSAPCPAI